jgi:hypothetical protein
LVAAIVTYAPYGCIPQQNRTALGLRATDGSLLTANQVRTAYSSEKAARGERHRRSKQQLVQTTAPAVQPPPPTDLAEPGDEPEPTRRGFQFTKSRPKIHRKE